MMKLAIMIGFMLPAFATLVEQTAEDVSSALKACRAIDADAQRLKCYDAILKPLKKRKEQTAPLSVHVPQGQNTSSAFGADRLKKRENATKEPTSITAKITRRGNSKSLKLAFIYLDNGQLWRQVKSDKPYLHLPQSVVGRSVVLEKKILGNYMLKIEGYGRAIRVERLK